MRKVKDSRSGAGKYVQAWQRHSAYDSSSNEAALQNDREKQARI